MKKENIIHTAIENLIKTTGLKAKWKAPGIAAAKGTPDGVLTIDVNGRKLEFTVVVKTEIRIHNIIEILHQNLLNQKKTGKPLLILATKLYPNVKELLRKNKTAYLETNGNIYIEQEGILLRIDDQKPLQQKKIKTNRAFAKTGIKVLLLYLIDEEWLNRPYRQVAQNAGVALGTIPVIIAALRELGYLINVYDRIKLVNKEELIKRWVEAYGEKLKPNIKLGNFWLDDRSEQNWKQINWIDEQALWGGEPAADLLTNHLNPQEFTLYTTQNIKGLIKNYHLLPRENGQVAVYEKFWKFQDETQKTAPPLIVYADLIHTNDSRCIETANIIYERYLSKNI